MSTSILASVRRAAPADANALAALRLEFRASRAATVETAEQFLARCTVWMRERLGESSAWRVWIAAAPGTSQPVGHVWLQVVEKVPNPTAERERHGYVSNFYVHPAHRNAGAGSALLRAALDECERAEVDTVFLWPTAESRPLYERHGFRVAGGMLVLDHSTTAH